MKRLTTLAVLFLSALGAFAQVTDHRQIKTPPLRTFSIPQPKRIALPNGMVIFLQEDHELPLISGSATIRGGGRDVPAEKTGLVGIYAGSWRTGGTTTKTGDELDEFLEARAASVETGGDVDSTSIAMSVLKADFDTVFPIWLDVLRNPAFREDKIELSKTQARTAISRRNDDPGSIVSREVLKLGYGADSPYARHTEYATIAAITRDDLVAFHKRTVHPNNMILSFIGDFDSARVEKLLRDTFASWPRGPQIAKPALTMAPAKAGVYFVAKEDVTQANIAMVHPGIERNNPDFYAVTVMNEIFGGGFSGRLLQKLRSERGLTYGVGGGIGADWDNPGLFSVRMGTKSGTTLESIDALRGEINRLVTAPITAEEMSLAKESLLNAFVFTMDTRAKALNQQVLLEFYGFPSNYFTQYPGMIEKVTAADVQRVAKQYVHPDRLAVLVVGNEKQFEKPLSTLGQVTTIDVTIPEGNAAKKSAAPATGNAEGMALARKVRDFIGGADAIRAVNASRTVATLDLQGPQGAMTAEATTLIRYPNSMRQEMTLPMGKITTVIAPDAAFVITPMGTQELPASRRDAALADMKTDFFYILRNLDDPSYVISAGATEKIGGTDARALDIAFGGTSVRWYVEPATGRILRTVRQTTGSGPTETVTDYTEWKRFGTVQMPTAATITRNGENAGAMRMTAMEANPAIEANAFVKP